MPALNLWLLAAVVLSALAVVLTQHEARKLYIRGHEIHDQTRQLELERTQLQLERSTLSAHARVEQIARDRLDMAIPTGQQVRILQP